MCGVCGFAHHQMPAAACRAVLQTMCGLLSHRGPDDEGLYVDEDIALGHRRLSIIDLSAGGHQPMSADGLNAWISFNGEIYNFLDLKAELSARGCRFRTRTDTEVILRAYQVFGEAFVEHLNGMFAIALWDADDKKLLLVRDRLGKKPLYYFYHNERFVFASEMKAILSTPGVPRDIDLAALDHFLTHGYIPAPWSIFKHIRKVTEAGYLVFQGGKVREKRYWTLPQPESFSSRSEDDYAEELETLLQDAVRCRLISDVPLGAFLSGGVDSSAIVAMMVKLNGKAVKTFTIDFNENTFSEVEDARRVADHCGTEHHVDDGCHEPAARDRLAIR
jgi:asparagine synthase (glutamine-hydrolysing)